MEQITVCIIIVYLCFIPLDSNIINIVIKYYNYCKLLVINKTWHQPACISVHYSYSILSHMIIIKQIK